LLKPASLGWSHGKPISFQALKIFPAHAAALQTAQYAEIA